MPRAHRTTVSQTKPSLMARLTGGRAGHIKTEQRTTTTHPATTTTGHRHHATTGSTGVVRRSPRSHGIFSTREPVQHHKRKATIGDKVSGGLLKLKGSLTNRPGVKAAGTRRQHGTDGRGSHRVY